MDKVYDIAPNSSSFSGGGITIDKDYKAVVTTTDTAVYAQKNNININKEFIISGAGGGTIKGGFRCRYNLFYTNASLYLYNFRLHLTQEDDYASIFINLENGVDQLQVINCEFTSDGLNEYVAENTQYNPGTKGHYLRLYSPNTRPYKLKEGEIGGFTESYYTRYNGEIVTTREVEDYNYINHIYVKNSSFMGCIVTLHGGTRVVKTARFVNNIVTDLTSSAIYWGCPNIKDVTGKYSTWDMCALSYGRNLTSGKTYLSIQEEETGRWIAGPYNNFSSLRASMSCPVYIVGNSFSGGIKDNKPIIYLNKKNNYLVFYTENKIYRNCP